MDEEMTLVTKAALVFVSEWSLRCFIHHPKISYFSATFFFELNMINVQVHVALELNLIPTTRT